MDERVWFSPRRTPPYYPDAVTLRADAGVAEVVAGVDLASRGCSVKDSFAALDLTAEGFAVLFDAQWIHRPAGASGASETPPFRTELVTTAGQLLQWAGGNGPPDVFRPALLNNPSVRVLGFHDAAGLVGGAVLNEAAGVVGVSNVFAVDDADIAAVWAATVSAAAGHFPGVALVGYEQGDDLAPALAGGFGALGSLRVWSRGSA
ncbi:hypothetical protein [Streptomyces sp. NBRC 109706]|uniref:hypothetical protein n=1 Tax=Streptomyces sp. NBRC 109706 TaxID=1550035 RepID=UPI001F420B9E|nr:hypothetical protein [Streptomyces sp. NBRC 109706]